jgi:hypothetical protein
MSKDPSLIARHWTIGGHPVFGDGDHSPLDFLPA